MDEEDMMDCCQECLPTLKNNKLPTVYRHLGSAQSEQMLKKKFEVLSGYLVSTGDLKLQELWHKENKNKTTCNIHTSELQIDAKLTILYKRNVVDCPWHQLVVVAILEQDVISGKKLDWLKSQIWDEMLPRIKFTSEGHDSVSEESRRDAKKDLKKQGTLSKEKKLEMKKETELKHHCRCNGPPGSRTGGFATWGCTLKKFGAPKCKFNVPTDLGRKKFHLKNLQKNDTVVEEICQSLADIITDRCLVLAPLASKYMLSEAANTQCRLGTRNKMFSAMSLNSNFRIHSHVDKKDFPNGVTALINVHKSDKLAGQLHILVDYSLSENGTPGISINLKSGSLLLECASREWHAATKPIRPNLKVPSRVALVFFSHKHLNLPNHGSEV